VSRIILTTCGTSLYTSSCWKGLNDPPISTISLEDQKTIRKRQSKCEGLIMDAQKEDPTGETFAQSFDAVSWNNLDRLRDLPAELASLRVILESLKSKNEGLDQEDKIILLHSDNNNGRFCASVIKLVLEKQLQGVVIKPDKINGLDPVSAQQLVDALKTTWKTYYNMLSRNSDKFIFNLTGGYKATSLILAALSALFALSADVSSSGVPDITITYLHESAPPDNLFNIYWDKEKSFFNAIQFGFGTKDKYGEIAGSL